MRQHLLILFISFVTLFAFGQSSPKYQTATVIAVQAHQFASDNSDADDKGASKPAYDVSLRIKNEVYVVLYTPREDTGATKYAAGRNALVLVGEKTIKWNDIMGTTFEMPILSKKSIAAPAGKPK
jgi:hypothetical protein